MRIHNSPFILISLLLFISSCYCGFWDFLHPFYSYGPSIREEGLHNVTSLIGFDNIRGHIACIGDFDSDKYSDLFVLGCDDNCVEVWLWKHTSWKFEKSEAVIHLPNITNVIAGDFNSDGLLDVLLMTRSDEDGKQEIHVYTQAKGGKFNTTAWPIPPEIKFSKDQVFALDYNGDMKIDLYGTDYRTGKRAFWENTGDNFVMKYQEDLPNTFPLAVPANNAFIDLNGDCTPDLFVSSCPDEPCEQPVFEFYINENGKLKSHSTFIPPKGAGQVTFVDVDRDGALDLVFPVCYPKRDCSESNYIAVYYNQQKKMCTGIIRSENCRPQSDLCTPSEFKFNEEAKVEIQLPEGKILPNLSIKYTKIPPKIRFGDYNSDAYPDFLITVLDTKSGEQSIELYENTPCDQSTVKCNEKINLGMRTFIKVEEHVAPLSANTLGTSYIASWMDFDERGTHDIFINKVDETTKEKYVEAIYNNFYIDGYFFKTLVLGGAAPHFEDKPYLTGVNMPGSTVKLTISDIEGNPQVFIASHLSQSSYFALQTPYHLFGLGRTAGYVEDLYVGVPKRGTADAYWNVWNGLIPNSQLVISPYPRNDPSQWWLEMYVNPSSHLLWVIIAFLSTLILLALPIALLMYLERRSDEKEKRKETQNMSDVFI